MIDYQEFVEDMKGTDEQQDGFFGDPDAHKKIHAKVHAEHHEYMQQFQGKSVAIDSTTDYKSLAEAAAAAQAQQEHWVASLGRL
eukprot:SAG31_NODE_31433_length_368_cov_0.843866_1_plen_83_part_01